MNDDNHIDSIRCSSLPEAFKCPGSLRLPVLQIDPHNDASAVGTAVHALMRDVVEAPAGQLIAAKDLPIAAVCAEHGVEQREVWPLMMSGIATWLEIRASFPRAETEVECTWKCESSGVTLTGHIDAITVDFDRINLLDWKSGRVDRDYSQQVRGYMALALLNNPSVQLAVATVAWLRDQEVETYSMDRTAMTAWVAQLDREVVAWDGVFHPGRHCGFCRRSHTCPALAAHVRRDLAVMETDATLAGAVEQDVRELAPTKLLEMWDRWKTVKAFGESFEKAVRRALEAGPIIADGRTLELVEQQRREVDVLRAWPAIEKRLDDAEVAACLSVSISELENQVGKKAGRGKGAEAKRELAAELEEAGAITTKTMKLVKEKRTP